MTKEEALKKIEELKAFIEECDKEIPKMPDDDYSPSRLCFVYPTPYGAWQECGRFQFGSIDTRLCYRIKAFELAHLMYARESISLNAFEGPSDAEYVVYFDKSQCKYLLSSCRGCRKPLVSMADPWSFSNKDDADKVCNYMNKYVKYKVKELY